MSNADAMPACDSVSDEEFTSLDALVSTHGHAHAAGDSLRVRQIESVFAHCFWKQDSAQQSAAIAALEADKLGCFYRLHRDVAQKLGFDTEAHESAMNWMVWASDRNDMPEYWHARARLAEDEAQRFVDFISISSHESADDSDIPLINRLTKDLVASRSVILTNGDVSDNRHALIDALLRVEKAIMAVRRPDKAAKLQEIIRTLAEREHRDWLTLAATMMEARALHFRGEVVGAARLCGTMLKSSNSTSVVSSITLRAQLAEYSVETNHLDTAIRMLQNNVAVTDAQQLDLEHLLAARELATAMALSQQTEELVSVAETALADCSDFPDCDAIMDLRLLLADEYLATGRPSLALDLSQAVANWSSTTHNFERTANACNTAALSAIDVGDMDHAAVLFTDLARIRSSYAAAVTPAETLMNAATELTNNGANLETVDALLAKSSDYISQLWEKAMWNESAALIEWSRWDDTKTRNYAETASQLFAEANMPADAARALTIAASAAVSANDRLAADVYARRVETLVPERHPIRESLRRILNGADASNTME